MRKLGIDYGDSRVGIAITDPLCITAQGLETIHHKGNDKIVCTKTWRYQHLFLRLLLLLLRKESKEEFRQKTKSSSLRRKFY
mgnify:CR=1 FL=1